MVLKIIISEYVSFYLCKFSHFICEKHLHTCYLDTAKSGTGGWNWKEKNNLCILMLIFLCLLHAKYMPINAYQQIHYSNGSLEESHLQEKPIYDGVTMIPVCKPTRAPGKVQICECPQGSMCSPALQPVQCKLKSTNYA